MKFSKLKSYFCMLLLLSSLCLLMPEPIYAQLSTANQPNIIRVALATQVTTSEVKIQQGNYVLVDMLTQFNVPAAEPANLVISPVGNLNLRLEAAGNLVSEMTGSLILVKQVDPNALGLVSYKGKAYRGDLMIQNQNGKLNIINILDIDHYLYGVLPKEMGISTAPLEALKAQAVVSRTYALKQKNAGSAYDLVATNSSQVYGGYSAEVSYATQAVDATKGQVIYYNNELINAYFSSNAGGFTENAENVWSNQLGYAKAVPSPYDAVVLNKNQDSTGWPGYCYQWNKRLTLADLQSRITAWNQARPQQALQIGAVTGLNGKALAYDSILIKMTGQTNTSGRITELEVSGTQGSAKLYKEDIRSFLELRSTMFNIIPEGGTLVRNGAGVIVNLNQDIQNSKGIVAYGQAQSIAPNQSTYHIVTATGVKAIDKNGSGSITGFLIEGKGYGHGVGMSQWGAIGMAEAGNTYQTILDYYYNQGKNDGRLQIKTIQ